MEKYRVINVKVSKYIFSFFVIFFLINLSSLRSELIFDDTINLTLNSNEDRSIKSDARIDNRFISSYINEDIGFKVDFHVLSSYSNGQKSSLQLPTNLVIKGDRTNLIRLTHESDFGTNDKSLVNRIDRLYFSAYSEYFEVTVGRSALTWSRARMFHVTDFFNPQTPGFYDGDYKIGTDLVYYNLSLDAGSNISIVANPKRDYYTEDITIEDSTFAFRYFSSQTTSDYSIIIANYLNDYTLAGGLSRDFIGGSVFRFDISIWSPEYDRQNMGTILMTSIEKSLYIYDFSTTVYMEYYHNDFGHYGELKTDMPFDYLMQKRYLNGDTYLLAKDYISLGTMIDITPYIILTYSGLLSLNDYSSFNMTSLSYQYTQNLDLSISVMMPYGSKGDEFGRLCNVAGDYCRKMGYIGTISATYNF